MLDIILPQFRVIAIIVLVIFHLWIGISSIIIFKNPKRYLKRHFKSVEEQKNDWRCIIILLGTFALLSIFFYAGFQKILWWIPNWVGSYDLDTDTFLSINNTLSGILGVSLSLYVFYVLSKHTGRDNEQGDILNKIKILSINWVIYFIFVVLLCLLFDVVLSLIT